MVWRWITKASGALLLSSKVDAGAEMVSQNVDLTVREILECAIKIEKRVADVYGVFSKRFSHVPGMSDFWTDLRRDEVGHMGELRVIFESLSAERLSALESRDISMGVCRALKSVDDECLSQVKTLDDAYEIARSLESSEINTIFEYLTVDLASPSSRDEMVTTQIEEHEKKLMDFDQQYGDKNWRLKFSIQPE